MKDNLKIGVIGVVLLMVIASISYSMAIAVILDIKTPGASQSTARFSEPTSIISKDIVQEVAKNGSIKFDIGSMCMNNPENIYI